MLLDIKSSLHEQIVGDGLCSESNLDVDALAIYISHIWSNQPRLDEAVVTLSRTPAIYFDLHTFVRNLLWQDLEANLSFPRLWRCIDLQRILMPSHEMSARCLYHKSLSHHVVISAIPTVLTHIHNYSAPAQVKVHIQAFGTAIFVLYSMSLASDSPRWSGCFLCTMRDDKTWCCGGSASRCTTVVSLQSIPKSYLRTCSPG